MVKHRTRERFEWYANAEIPHKIRLPPEFEPVKIRRFSTLSQRNPEYLFPLISGRFRPFPLGNTSFPAFLSPLFPCAPCVEVGQTVVKQNTPNAALAASEVFFVVCMVTLNQEFVKGFRDCSDFCFRSIVEKWRCFCYNVCRVFSAL